MDKFIDLVQIESSDLIHVQRIVNAESSRGSSIEGVFSVSDVESWLGKLNSRESYFFGIKAIQDGLYRKGLIGVCAVTGIDWINRTANIMFLMDGASFDTFAKIALQMVLRFCFKTINVRKLSIELLKDNKVMPLLESFGFVAEGIRVGAVYKGGFFTDSAVCSILAQDYMGAS